MGSVSGLRAHLEKWKADADATAVDQAALQRDLSEWVEDLLELMDRLHGWLRDPEQDGLLQIVRESTTLTEARYGTYDAPAMVIQAPGPRAVHVHPVGIDVLGNVGRVDLESGPRKVRLLRKARRTWRIAVPSRSSRASFDLEDLDEQSFASILDELLVSARSPFAE